MIKFNDDKVYAVVLQAVRHNQATDKKVLYVLGVKLAKTKDLADKHAEELQKKGYITDVLPAELLPDLV